MLQQGHAGTRARAEAGVEGSSQTTAARSCSKPCMRVRVRVCSGGGVYKHVSASVVPCRMQVRQRCLETEL